MIVPMTFQPHFVDSRVVRLLSMGSHPAVEEASTLWPTLAHLEGIYPGFRNWYFGKVVAGLAAGSRHILRAGSMSDPTGIAIVKREHGEAKICTLWVAEQERHGGLGLDLFQEAIEWCDTDKPLFTVPEERYDEFVPLLRRHSFEETARVRSLYRPGVIEHIFNGLVRPTLQS